MSTTVVINGLNYFIPAVGENNWGQNVTDALVALAAVSSGSGFFTRVSVSSSPITVVSGRTYLVDTSAARTLNLPAPANNAYLIVKDVTGQAASNNITIARNGSESIDGVAADKVLNINNAFCWLVSDGTNWFSVSPPYPLPYGFLTLTGSIVNADVSGSAAIAYSKLNLAGSIVNADINASAAIAYSKLAALTASRALVSDGSGVVSASAVTAAELGYLAGVTSAIQTQLDAKLALAGGTMAGAIAMGTNKITGLGDGTAAADAAAFGQIKYLSAPVQTVNTTAFSTSSGTAQSTNLTASITPSSSSSRVKITLSGMHAIAANATGFNCYLTLFRDSTNLAPGGGGFMTYVPAIGVGAANISRCAITYIDSPATTSPVTYTVKIWTDGGVSGSFGQSTSAQLMILEEIR